ncbi:2OG-Fe(II) oxygenase [Phenylobacterium sp. SCN 70-31]|uniref:2OG-Fe(II) oxygenase family protein n=1 Tax=Phenylobacterium sp. SCN 70-31 TaxID=1660129 RepID=UPI00086FA038|nr:2OG-Fe(II) oxygenase [Phenylobacterium sp. SCN 70-31]ODT87502.1 MAG: peroxiredoxin [Phenylobacterium sp. SCN 70-31]
MSLRYGQPAPWFIAPTASSPEFVFDTAAGRYVVLLLPPQEPGAYAAALQLLAADRSRFDDVFASAFVIVPPGLTLQGAQDLRGLRWVLDGGGAITARYGPEPQWILLDPTLRVMSVEPVTEGAAFMRRLAALPPPAAHADTPLHAPVLVAPRIFEPELCAALMAMHAADGGAFTGVMRDAGDRTLAVMDDLKRRRDIWIAEPALQAALRERLERRLFPFIELALGFRATRIERYLVSCYDAADGGVFHPHRDNTTHGTAHRRFACSLNLNDDFEGGDLRFAEYGPQTYRPPPGGAVVFSCALMHEARPVTRGRRYAFLPFFFDEAGAAVRAAYEARQAAHPMAPPLAPPTTHGGAPA